MYKKILTALLAVCLLACSAFGQGREYFSVTFVDEWGDPRTDVTQVDVENTSGTDIAVYSTQHGSTEVGSTGVITTGLSDGTVEFWYEDTSIDLGVTDGTHTLEIETFTNTTYRYWFPSHLNAFTGSDYGVNDDIDFTYASWIIDGDTTNRLDVIPDNDNSVMGIGSTTYTADLELFGGSSGYDMFWDSSRNQLLFQDNAVLGIGGADDAAGDVTMTHDGSDFYLDAAIASEGWLIGDTTSGFDIDIRFETAGSIFVDYDGDFLTFTDDMDARFGTGAGTKNGDFMISGDSAPLLTIDVVVAGAGEIAIGNDADDVPVKWYAETGSDWVYFNADEVEFEDVVLQIMDDTEIHLGDDDDVTLRYDETTDDNFEIVAGSVGMSIVTNDFLATLDGAAADQFKVDATGTVAGNAINFETTDGGILLNADGGSNGDITLDSADDLILTSAGKVTITNTEVVTVSGGSTLSGVTTIAGSLITPVEIVAATNEIEITESGTVFILNHGTEFATTLPTVATSAGVTFRFIVGVDPAGTAFTVVTDSLEDAIEGSVVVDGANIEADGPDDTITFTASAAVVGDWCELTSDGVLWYLSGQGAAATSIVPTKAD